MIGSFLPRVLGPVSIGPPAGALVVFGEDFVYQTVTDTYHYATGFTSTLITPSGLRNLGSTNSGYLLMPNNGSHDIQAIYFKTLTSAETVEETVTFHLYLGNYPASNVISGVRVLDSNGRNVITLNISTSNSPAGSYNSSTGVRSWTWLTTYNPAYPGNHYIQFF